MDRLEWVIYYGATAVLSILMAAAIIGIAMRG